MLAILSALGLQVHDTETVNKQAAFLLGLKHNKRCMRKMQSNAPETTFFHIHPYEMRLELTFLSVLFLIGASTVASQLRKLYANPPCEGFGTP